MIVMIGALCVIFSVFFGFIAGGGHLHVLWQPFEFLIIMGSSIGALLTSCTPSTLKTIPSAVKSLYRGPRYQKRDYLDLILLLYTLLRTTRTKGALALERHVENPEDSTIFQAFPGIMKSAHAVTFLCDYFRMLTMGTESPHEVESLFDEELETLRAQQALVPDALQMIADGMPALGIVAAVLGVIHTMGSITEPPEVLGGLIAAALVGTFLGVLLSYGFVGPISSGIRSVYTADIKYFECIKAALVAHLNGCAPAISVEFARKSLYTDMRPTFYEVEEAIAAAPAVNT